MRCPGERRQGTVEMGSQHCGRVRGDTEEPKVTSDF